MSRWVTRIVSVLALVVVAWVLVTAWPVVVHGHPLYAALLGLTVIGAVIALVRSLPQRDPRSGWRRVLWVVSVVAAIIWIGTIAWLKPFSAQEPSLAAMQSDDEVTVTETPTAIVMAPAQGAPTTGVLFQPGARVDARAYAGLMRPLAAGGDLVVIPKQPIGLAFLSTGALATARSAHPEIKNWVVGGHSLGGTVASSTALSDAEESATAPVTGLLLYASYPASDSRAMNASVLSISGSEDGLATPDDIAASKANLPESAQFVVVEGGTHAFFGDYGSQPGDGVPGISRADAQAQIVDASTDFLGSLPVRN